jgi:hypothetical protein
MEQNIALGNVAVAAVGTVGTFFTPSTGANPQFMAQSGVVPAGGGAIAVGAPVPAGNTIVIVNTAVPLPVAVPGPAGAPGGNLPYEPLGQNATPINPAQRTDQLGNPIPCAGGGNCGGSPGALIGAIGNNQALAGVPSLTTVNNNPPGASAGTGGFNVNINSNWAPPTAGPSIAGAAIGTTTVAQPNTNRNNVELNSYGTNTY